MNILQFTYNPKNNGLYIQFQLPILLNRDYILYFTYAILKNTNKSNIKGVSVSPMSLKESVKLSILNNSFSYIQLSGIDMELNINIAYKLELNKSILTVCFMTNEDKLDICSKRIEKIFDDMLRLYVLEHPIDKAKIKNDNLLISEQEFLKYYNQNSLLQLLNSVSTKASSILILNDKNKLALYFRSQNGLYAIPIDVWKNGEREKRSQGYYFTENAKKIMKMRSVNNETSNVGQDLTLVNVKPIYSPFYKQKYITIYNSIANLRKDYRSDNADVCYCTLADIKGEMNSFDKNKFEDDSQLFLYKDGFHSLFFKKSDTIIKDFHFI